MQNCDDIIIELSKSQSITEETSNTWTTQLPSLILEEGDIINCEGGWISVLNAGDNSIEIIDKQNPQNEQIDASFDLSYYKIMDTRNVVSFPYHSLKLQEEETDLLGTGFDEKLPVLENYENPTYQEYDGNYPVNDIKYYNVPKVIYPDGSQQLLPDVSTYDNLVNELNADKFEEGSYEDFLINSNLKQGIRDLANTGNYYTCMYRTENGKYKLYTQKVNVDIPKGYYSPQNLSAFITQQIQTKIFNKKVNDFIETWTNMGRYFKTMSQVPVMNTNKTIGVGEVLNGAVGNPQELLTLNTMSYDLQKDEINQPSVSSQTGFHQQLLSEFQIIDILPTDETTISPRGYYNYVKLRYNPITEKDKIDMEYIKTIANEYTGINNKYTLSTNNTFYQEVFLLDNSNNRVQVSNGFKIMVNFLINGGGTNPNPTSSFITGWISKEDTNPMYPNEPVVKNEDGTYDIIITIFNGQPDYIDDATLTSLLFSPNSFMPSIWNGVDVITPENPIYVSGYSFFSVAGMPTFKGEMVRNSYQLCFCSAPVGMPFYCGRREILILGGYEFLNPITITNNPQFNWCPVLQTGTPKYDDELYPPDYSLEDCKLDYENGNQALGMTTMNWNRWNYMNWEEPPKVSQEELDNNKSQELEPILRKYPLFMEKGMETNTYPCNFDIDGNIIYDTTQDPIYPDIIDFQYSTLTLTPINQDGNVIVSNSKSNATNMQNWYNFIKSQVDDGLVSIKPHTFKDTDFFYIYTHFCIGNRQYLNTNGSDEAMMKRPRGLLCRVHLSSFLNKSKVEVNYNDRIYIYKNGILIAGNSNISLDTYSWIYDKNMKTDTFTNYGFQDYNLCLNTEPLVNQLDSNLSLKDNFDTGLFSMGWGYSYKKLGWRNYTSMLCSYSVEEKNAISYLFDSKKNRVVQNNIYLDPEPNLSVNDRVFLGSDNSQINFDTDGSGRFSFENMFITNKVANKYFEGIINDAESDTLLASTQRPFYRANQSLTNNTTFNPYTENETGEDIPESFGNNNPANDNAGIEIIQYNKGKRDLFNDALIQLAVENSKHQPLIYNIPFVSGQVYGVGQVEQTSYNQGNWFKYIYPVNTDNTTRFFCFDQDARYNSWLIATKKYNQSVYNTYGDINKPYGTKNLVEFPNDDFGIKTFVWNDYNGQYKTGFVEGTKYLTPSLFWGNLSGDTGFIKKNYEAGTIRPNKEVIYDTLGGIQIYNWGIYNETNWDKSIWSILGFTKTDLLVEPFQYCNQQRNFTTNFMTETNENFRTKSFPFRNDADLTKSGFITTTSNRQGELQYTLQYPKENLISQLGIQGINRETESIFVLAGFVNSGGLSNITNPTFETIDSSVGVSYINGQLVLNEFEIAFVDTTKNYASKVANKLQSPFYLVRSDLPEDNFKYLNNAGSSLSTMSIVGVLGKQYGATSDWYYSSDQANITFTNKRKRVINSIKISLTENSGQTPTIQPNSTIFMKIRRNVAPKEINYDELQKSLEEQEKDLDEKQKKLYEEEIKEYINF
jgi:hypothetical protein